MLWRNRQTEVAACNEGMEWPACYVPPRKSVRHAKDVEAVGSISSRYLFFIYFLFQSYETDVTIIGGNVTGDNHKIQPQARKRSKDTHQLRQQLTSNKIDFATLLVHADLGNPTAAIFLRKPFGLGRVPSTLGRKKKKSSHQSMRVSNMSF